MDTPLVQFSKNSESYLGKYPSIRTEAAWFGTRVSHRIYSVLDTPLLQLSNDSGRYPGKFLEYKD